MFIAFFLGIGATYAAAQGKWTPFIISLEGNPPIAAAFLNEQFGFVKTDNAAFRTTDGGKTWTKLQAMPWTVSWSDAPSQFYFYAPNDIFLDGKYESIDSGNTWKQLLSPTPSGELYIKDGIFFDASGNVSYDHSTTWTTASGFQNEIIGSGTV
jgi:hypothetical protein